MAIEQFVNNTATTLNGSITSGATTLVVTSATGFPTAGNFRLIIDSEIMLVTSVSGTTFTVTRGVESTSAAAHSNLATVVQTLTNGGLAAIFSALITPQGRLTLQSATPVMTSDTTAAGTIYYDTYAGHIVPVNQILYQIPSDEVSLILDATHHLSTNLYDIFAINNSGTLQIVTGPAWTNSTTRSAAIALSNGLWTNSGSLTHAYNNNVDYGPISANAGTYLGTFYATANAQTGMQFTPAGAAGGSNNILGLFNAYNQVPIVSVENDSTASWGTTSSTWRPADNNNNNRISFVDGLQQSFLFATYMTYGKGPQPLGGSIGINLDSTSATPIAQVLATVGVTSNAAFQTPLNVVGGYKPVLGLHFVQAMESNTSNTSTVTYAGGANYTFTLALNM